MKDNNFGSTKARPTSRKKIRNFTAMLRENFLTDPNSKIKIIDFLERTADVLGINYEIVQDKDLPNNYAETDLNKRLIRFRESVYIGAVEHDPRDRFTVAHEIGHCLLHAVENGVKLCRNDEEIKIYENPEWQASTFAAEFLVPYGSSRTLSEEEIREKFSVSKKVANIQKNCK